MIKFINKIDGSVFYAEPNTVQFTVLNNDSNYEIEEVEDEETKEEQTDQNPVETKEGDPVEEVGEKPTKTKAAK